MKAILFVIGLAVGAIAIFVWKKSECDDLAKKLAAAEQQVQQSAAQIQQNAAQIRQLEQRLAGAQAIYIGPESKDLNPPTDVTIYVKDSPVVYWKPWLLGASHPVNVVFPVKGFPKEANGYPPFVNGKQNQPQQISCSGETCFSYDLNPDILPIVKSLYPNGLTYKYSQSVDGKPLYDGRIIIKQQP